MRHTALVRGMLSEARPPEVLGVPSTMSPACQSHHLLNMRFILIILNDAFRIDASLENVFSHQDWK